MSDLGQVATWRRLLGFLPVPLFGRESERAFVLLNGGKGNFCLDIGESAALGPAAAASRAWSADVDHYVAIHNNALHLLRWDEPRWTETYPLETIEKEEPRA